MNTEQTHTGQYVDIAVLAFVVGVIRAVCSDAHVDRTRLNLLKHTNSGRVNAKNRRTPDF